MQIYKNINYAIVWKYDWWQNCLVQNALYKMSHNDLVFVSLISWLSTRWRRDKGEGCEDMDEVGAILSYNTTSSW